MPALALMVVLTCLPSLAAEVPEDNQDKLAAFVAELLAAPNEAAWRDLLETHSDQVTHDLALLLRDRRRDFTDRAQFDLALKANAICLEIAVRLRDRGLEAYCVQHAAEIHLRRQDYAQAAAKAREALAILEELEGVDPELRQLNEALTHINLGSALHKMCEYEAALEQYQQAYLIARASPRFDRAEAGAQPNGSASILRVGQSAENRLHDGTKLLRGVGVLEEASSVTIDLRDRLPGNQATKVSRENGVVQVALKYLGSWFTP